MMNNGNPGRKETFLNICRALSCFMPLFPVFFVENICGLFCNYTQQKHMGFWDSLWVQSIAFYGNALMCVVWVFLFMGAVVALCELRQSFLDNSNISGDKYILTKAESTTADFYFTYFSLFVLSFYSVDPTNLKDCLLFFVLMILIVWVYVSNELYYINPVLALQGYRFFTISGYKVMRKSDGKKVKKNITDIKVVSKDRLNHLNGKIGKDDITIEVKYSPFDFTVCKLVDKEEK